MARCSTMNSSNIRSRAPAARNADRGAYSPVELDALGDYLQAAMAHSPVEQVRVMFLNAKNLLIANEAIWTGSIDEAAVHVR